MSVCFKVNIPLILICQFLFSNLRTPLLAAKVRIFFEYSINTFLNNLLHTFGECHIAADALCG